MIHSLDDYEILSSSQFYCKIHNENGRCQERSKAIQKLNGLCMWMAHLMFEEMALRSYLRAHIVIEHSLKFGFFTSNNKGEYMALIFGLGLALKFGATSLKIFSDSQLMVNQVNETYVA